MESTSFKSILGKFKQGANSMEEVYAELTYLTTNYDKEIEKLHKDLEDEKTRANNEEFVRKEAEKNLEDLRKLQEINFSVIVEGLIKKPKEEFELRLRSSLRKITVSIIFLTILSITLISASFLYFQKNNIQTTVSNSDTTQINKVLNEIKKENKKLKEYIEENIKNINLKKEEIITTLPPEAKNEKIELEKNKDIVSLKEIEKKNLENEIQDEDLLQNKILSILVSYDKKFKLSGKNNSRLLYKMFLLDLAPFKHDLILQEMKLFAKDYTHIPTNEELLIWDKQMLYIYTKMLEKIENIPDSKVTASMRSFHNYKKDDATVYGGWEYVGEENLSIKESLKNEIKKLHSQIDLNNK